MPRVVHRHLGWLCGAAWGIALGAVSLAAPPPTVTAESVIITDRETGEVAYEIDPDEPREIASLTKMMSAIVACEEDGDDGIVPVSEHAASTGEATAHLSTGDEVEFDHLLTWMLMGSANDASVAVAEHVAGSEAAFIDLMNQWALKLGCEDTHFANPHGLDADMHWSTARDLATIGRHLLSIPKLARIVSQARTVLPKPGDPDETEEIESTNELLSWRRDVDGVKTGHTSKAGGCLCASARQGDRGFIVVVLDSEARFHETDALLDWAFATIERVPLLAEGRIRARVPVLEGEATEVDVAPAETFELLLRTDLPSPDVRYKPAELVAPVAPGDRAGEFVVVHQGVEYPVPGLAVTGVRQTWWRRILVWPQGALLVASAALLAISIGLMVRWSLRRNHGDGSAAEHRGTAQGR